MTSVVSDDAIRAAVESLYDESVSFLTKIVAIDSTLEVGEGNVQSAVWDHLVANLPGYEVERLPLNLEEIQDQKGFSPVDWEYDSSKFNVVARRRGSSSCQRSCIYQGHVDVVPANESDGWTNPPFEPVIKEGRLYGRGAGDMKAGVVSMMYAVIALHRMGYAPGGNFALATVVEEECTGNGSLVASLDKLLPTDSTTTTQTAVIIPEPFPFLVTAQLGVLWFTARVVGRPCHVLQTSAGSNAIEGAFALYNSLKQLEETYNKPLHPAFHGMEHPVNFNLGRIEGGNWASSVPSSCWFQCRVGFFPDITIEKVKEDIESTLHQASERLGLQVTITYAGFHADGAVLLPKYVEGTDTSSDVANSLQQEFVETLQQCHKSACQTEILLPMKPITCTCDCRFYSSVFQDPERVVVTCMGPESTNIHGVDESVSLQDFQTKTVTLALFLRDWLGLIKY
mmetsp:Transcript_18454/g.27885  ORF Transcript_18454/g.27885 Transcript_18454/m.27885 type:complete len:454 (-) Transcript_18454:75-1436(-)|eukprot:CAMPEP_0178904142 /NCGR_PEP_ID=MMETSP0786-20121207/5535_1 /TAXON_ID=186022 /ORGANISM="Thalassionema frauenfeldii, Strain CCMP 1798" /LENGTH=453 /DNA_ID=CAMNT_0020575565 /DNA_START=38 /DNA_END=1399 /DNA_ORIENTATION=+